MDIAKEIMLIMNDIEYGFKDNNNSNIINNKLKWEKEFYKFYYLMPPNELLLKKCGICWDQVELERNLFENHNIKIETYFIFNNDNNMLPSHTFLIFYYNNIVYWFEHSWYEEVGIHEYNDLNTLLNDVELKFIKSKEKEINKLDIHIYKYNKPNFNISCDDFYKYIYTQKEIFNYKLVKSTKKDIDRLIKYKQKTIFKYATNLSKEEENKINVYINNKIPNQINNYKNIVFKNKIIGCLLLTKIEDGLLIDELYIESDYRNKEIGTNIIKQIIGNIKKDIYLWVYKDNKNAIKLYKSLGFIVLDETDTRNYMIYKR